MFHGNVQVAELELEFRLEGIGGPIGRCGGGVRATANERYRQEEQNGKKKDSGMFIDSLDTIVGFVFSQSSTALRNTRYPPLFVATFEGKPVKHGHDVKPI